ncbi:hypothetical protein J1614_010874 [Plenodomus biglobosus]|nr:hypothetical protein J1614_010874 [Plenodomus biglobosus]
MSDSQHRTPAPQTKTSPTDCHTPLETLRLTEQAAIAKAHLSLPDLCLKSFLGGLSISLGAAYDLIIVGGAPTLRRSNPALATLLGALCFPIGFAIIILLNLELSTSNMFIMPYGALRRRVTVANVLRNWAVSYVANIAGCLFYAGLLCYWCDSLSLEAQRAYAAAQADARVNVNWGFNVSKGIVCNWLVGIAFFFATQGRDFLSKVLGIWIAIAAFVAMGFQHSIANYLLVPIGMMYGGTQFGVGKFIWASCVPVTIGNIIGGAFFGAFGMWMVYGRHEQSVEELEKEAEESNDV